MRPSFKFCRCCGKQAQKRARKCQTCGFHVIWDWPTAAQIAEYEVEREAANERAERTFNSIMKTNP